MTMTQAHGFKRELVFHCASHSMDNASASLNEGNCQSIQREGDQTDEQFTLSGNLDKAQF